VEGTGSYGAALARHLAAERVKVIEVNRPDRRQRRAKGKSDPLDAYAAAEAVLADKAQAVPKAGDGIVESIRALHLVRSGAVKASGCCLPSRVLALPCRLNPSRRSKSATVSALTLYPWRVSSPASLRVDLVVHRSGDIGSPRSCGSTNASSAGTSPGSRSA
jgi:hypothetical protein